MIFGFDAFSDELLDTADSIESVEPYHLASAGDLLAYTAGDRLGIVGPDGPTTVTNDWMAYLHTADFSADRERVLVVSTGFDTIQELDLDDNKIGAAGMSTLAGACASGALDKLETLRLDNNNIGDAGHTATTGLPLLFRGPHDTAKQLCKSSPREGVIFSLPNEVRV